MVKNASLVLLIFALSMVFGCLKIEKGSCSMEKYEWLPSESGFKQYPMGIIKGDFIFSDNSSKYIPGSATINNGWGRLLSMHISGEALQPVPVKLSIHWFSYVEDKFYKGIFDLPPQRLPLCSETELKVRGDMATLLMIQLSSAWHQKVKYPSG